MLEELTFSVWFHRTDDGEELQGDIIVGGLNNKENQGMLQVLHPCLYVYSKTYKTLILLSDPNVYDFQTERDTILRMVIF